MTLIERMEAIIERLESVISDLAGSRYTLVIPAGGIGIITDKGDSVKYHWTHPSFGTPTAHFHEDTCEVIEIADWASFIQEHRKMVFG